MKKLIFGIAFVLLCSVGTTVFAASNPVVQIVGYDAVGGRYPNMLGWGSASIISDDGLILTNNHVVDNGRGGTLPGFSVCITTTDTQRPKCHYTASLIARDIRRDISLLRIDPVDIFGNVVDFAAMTSIDLDYSYVPKAGDTVTAVGYPWVGSNTITKTQGVVAGTQPYNDVSYIKTDALIAGGNSGGPLVMNDKVIGVNTFGIGGGFDASLGYALSIAEAQDFIQEHMSESATPVSPKLGFAEYLRRLEQINIDKKVSDSFVTMKFDTSYKVTHYISDLQMRGEIADPDIYHVQQFNIQRIKIPMFANMKEQEYYLKNQLQLYGSRGGGEKLKVTKIGGLDFYEPIYSSDPSGGEGYGYKRYFSVQSGTMVMVTLYAPLGNENTQTQVKANIDAFLANIQFGQIGTLSKQVFTLYDPVISLPYSDQSLVDVFGQMNWGFSEYYGWSSSYVNYLGNLYETLGLTVESNTLYDGKGKTAQQLLDAATSDIYGSDISVKGLVNYYGNQGYMICADSQRMTITDPQGRNHKMTQCMMRVVIGKEQDHIITISLTIATANLESGKVKFWAFADQVLKPLGDSSIGISIDDVLLSKNTTMHQYSDISDQDPQLQKLLNNLVGWSILKDNSLFNGDYPLLWQDYIKLYLKMVYNKNLTDIWSGSMTYGDLVATLPYDPVGFVPADVTYYNSAFELMLAIKLAGVDYDDFSEYGLSRFARFKETTYRDQWNQIQEREYSIYGDRVVSLYEAFGSVGDWYSDYTTTYNPLTRTLSKKLSSSKDPVKLDLGISVSALKDGQDQLNCYANKVNLVSNTCLEMWRNQVAQYVSYSVVTKGDAIDHLMSYMDIGLFDSTWAKKKETQIDTGMVE